MPMPTRSPAWLFRLSDGCLRLIHTGDPRTTRCVQRRLRLAGLPPAFARRVRIQMGGDARGVRAPVRASRVGKCRLAGAFETRRAQFHPHGYGETAWLSGTSGAPGTEKRTARPLGNWQMEGACVEGRGPRPIREP